MAKKKKMSGPSDDSVNEARWLREHNFETGKSERLNPWSPGGKTSPRKPRKKANRRAGRSFKPKKPVTGILEGQGY